jgi:hypothetical protein
MIKTIIISIAAFIITILGFIVFFFIQALNTGYTIKEMDWNNNGKTSISEIYESLDVGKRDVELNDTMKCIEYFDLKDGMPMKTICPGNLIILGYHDKLRSKYNGNIYIPKTKK